MGENTILEPAPIEPVNLREALEERYLSYALSTIMHRALPDVRDGLKPVHRRVLHAMRQLKLDPDGGFKKCARVVGDVIGKYHPHGDQSVYDALVRLAQSFAQRYPLVDGQGNFGNVDGDNAAAMRYTEARLTAVAAALLDGLDEDTVDFRETYDGEEKEPIVLPADFPNLLANGSSGIAVGMATSIPPHNAEELCDAALYLIRNPKRARRKNSSISCPARTSRPAAFWSRTAPRSSNPIAPGAAVFACAPAGNARRRGAAPTISSLRKFHISVQKSRLIEKIAELLEAKRLPLLADVRDELAEDVRLVLEPRSRAVDPLVLMEQLFRLTDLETRIPLNMNVLSRGQVPVVLGLSEALTEWLSHRKVVLKRRSEHRLRQIEHRLEVLEGYLVAYLNLDEVIRIIRQEDEPKAELIRRFMLTDVQAEAILNMRLRSLRKLEEVEIRGEHEKLTTEKRGLVALLASDQKQWERISQQITETKARFGKTTEVGRRRTSFAEVPEIDISVEDSMVEREPVTVIISEKGWIRALKGHQNDIDKVQFKAGDALRRAIVAQSTDKLVLFASNGKFFTLEASALPGGRGHGEPVRLMIDLEETSDIVDLFVHRPGRKLLIASKAGNGFVVAEDEVVAQTRKGKQIMTVSPPDMAIACVAAEGDSVACLGANRKLLIFPLEEVNELSRGRGVRLQKLRDGGLADVTVFRAAEGLRWQEGPRIRTMAEFAEWLGRRAQAGTLAPKGFPRNSRFGMTGLHMP